MPAGHPGAASRGAKVKTGSDGSGRDGAGRPSRVRRLAERGFKQAARVGRGTGRSVGCGASRSGGSSGRRRRQWAGRRVHRPGPARAPARGWPYPLCPVRGRERGQAGALCAPREHPDYIYQRVVSPQAPIAPSPITQSGQPRGRIRHLAPTSAPPGFRPPTSRPSGRLEPPNTGPIRAIRASRGPIRAGMRAQKSPGCSRGAQGTPPHHHPKYSPRSGRGSGFKSGRQRRPGRRGNGEPAPLTPPRPPPPALPHPTDQPVPCPPSPPA